MVWVNAGQAENLYRELLEFYRGEGQA